MTTTTTTPPMRRLPGSERPRHASHRLIGPVDADQRIGVTLVLRAAPGSPPLPSLADWQARPPAARRALSREAHARLHGASPDDLAEVEAYVRAHGLTVVDRHAGRRCVTVEGRAREFQSAFGVTLNSYEAPVPSAARSAPNAASAAALQVHHGYDGPVQVPDHLHGVILGVVGLDDRARGVPAGAGAVARDPAGETAGVGAVARDPAGETAGVGAVAGDPAGAGSLGVPALAARYHVPNPGAAGQTIGVIAPWQSSLVPAYASNDVLSTYFPSLSAGYTTAPTLTDVDLTVSGTTFSNSASAVAALTAANLGAPANGGVLELTQDICTAATLAQGANVNVYFTQSSEQGWLVFLNRVLHPQSEPAPTVVSCSWTLDLGDDSSYIGSLGDSSSLVALMTAQFQALAAIGVDVFIAQGDWGADNWWSLAGGSVPDGHSHVMYPASDPWVTSCGGTVLGTGAESAWGDAWSSTSPFGSSTSNFGSTGGGVSQTFTAPPYQTAAGITGATDSAGTAHAGRGVPDVAGMVGLTGFFANGIGYSFTGTSCVAPFWAGLAAVMRAAIGVDLGPLNNTLYALKDKAFNDVTSGDNSSHDTPANVAIAIPGASGVPANAPFFQAAAGWDACTGLGSPDGLKLLNGIASLLYDPNYYFQVNKGSFGLEEVKVNPTYPAALWLVLEGFTPQAVAAAAIAPAITLSLPGVTVTAGAAQPEIATQPNTPQRVLFPCTVKFAAGSIKDIAHGGVFPPPGSPPVPTQLPITSSVVIGGQILSAEAVLELEPGADPHFANYDAAGDNVFYLSQDLRVFTVTPGIDNAPVDAIALNAADNTHFDTGAGYQYIQALLAHLNATYSDPAGIDPFTRLPDQTNALSGDSSVTPTSIDPAHPTGTPFTNYNFAIARVRLGGAPNSTSGDNVRVLFRLFAAQTSDTDFSPLTYPATTDAEGQPLAPLLGVGNTTIPFFATGNFQANADFGAATDYAGNSVNNQPIAIGASGEAWAYYGCYLNVYPTANTVNGAAVQTLLPSTHSCLVAQLVYDDAPMPTGAGVLQGPEYSDNFAQRNLQITFSDNPGPPASHLVPQTFDARPGPAPGTGPLEDYPDELMIDWGAVPTGSTATIYWPQVASADVLALAHQVYSTHQLSAADAHTVECAVPRGFTFVPIPSGVGQNLAGLFSVQLPPGVTAGQEFVVTVRRLSTRRGPAKAPPPPAPPAPPPGPRIAGATATVSAADTLATGPRHTMRNWRYIVGTFAVRIPVSTPKVIRPLEGNTLAIMKWRLGQMKPGNRWIPVLARYIAFLEGRLRGVGGDPGAIEPSPWGRYGAPPDQGPVGDPGRHPGQHGHALLCEATGKIDGVFYDRFGDFEGFLLRAEDGRERWYRSREAEIESLVRSAWAERIVLTVRSQRHCEDVPVTLILRRAPPQPRLPRA